MPFNTVRLRPGVVTQLTPAQNEAGVSQSNLIRYHDGLIQKVGGWSQYISQTLGSTIREIHAWEGLAGASFLGVGATQELGIVKNGAITDVTPQTYTRNPTPSFSVSSGSNVITVTDPGSSASVFGSVFLNTPIAVGTTFLSGGYQVNKVINSNTYQILSSAVSNTTVSSSGFLPGFNTVAQSGKVTVTLSNNNYLSVIGLFYPFFAATTIAGLTIQGGYQVNSIIDSTTFTIVTPTQSSATSSGTMNGGLAQIVYYVGNGPPVSGSGFGVGGFGSGGFGLGSSSPVSGPVGTPITATDWTMDNWGEVLLACPTDGPIYSWSIDSGFGTATVIPQAPFFNGGIFISQPQQILVSWRSVESSGVQDNLIVRWSDSGNYTIWAVTSQTAAGSFHIPTGSRIIGGIQAGLVGVIWTDIDVWIMQYVGGEVVFNFTRVGTGCGMIAPHAAGFISGSTYWMGTNNFFTLGGGGAQVMPCSVWDFVFQNLNPSFTNKIRCATNSMFNEVMWFFPSLTSTGENDSYVRYNISEQEWDFGSLNRTSWVDVSPLGNPIGTTTTTIYQHEIGYNNDNIGNLSPSFTTGYWTIAEGEILAFVDWVLPDMKFGTYSGSQTANLQITFNALDYVGDTPRTYGPYSFTNGTEFLVPRLRGRFMSMTVSSSDANSFWRIGAIKYRWAPMGRR